MTDQGVKLVRVWAMVALAAALWVVAFALPWSNFWLKIAGSASLLALLSVWIAPPAAGWRRPDGRDLIRGIVSAMALWLIFWAGKAVSSQLFAFADGQIGAIYGKGTGMSRWGIFVLLLTVTGPAEEIFWRGFLQKQLMGRFGNARGWALATAAYALVHVCSMNFMLVGAAAVAGAFWGLLYWHWGRLWPVIISHALWSAFIFAVVPIP
ncbi:MAG: CPBP family intramembrane metalloprotease [Desulfobacterales bacterium]|nr:CPBP family intramembrane metalloprotease [Desulfobacterales bacterium]